MVAKLDHVERARALSLSSNLPAAPSSLGRRWPSDSHRDDLGVARIHIWCSTQARPATTQEVLGGRSW